MSYVIKHPLTLLYYSIGSLQGTSKNKADASKFDSKAQAEKWLDHCLWFKSLRSRGFTIWRRK